MAGAEKAVSAAEDRGRWGVCVLPVGGMLWSYIFAAAMHTHYSVVTHHASPVASRTVEESSKAGGCVCHICCAIQSSALADVMALPAKDGKSVRGGRGYSVPSCPDPA